jgi:CRP-like cAMP-binding protein
MAAVSAHPIAELLQCPPETSGLLSSAAQCLQIAPGEAAFRQQDPCRGLYVVVAGEFLRKTERMSMRVTLGSVRAGEIVELAAALSGAPHTYTLTALVESTLMMLPIDALHRAFEEFPPLRMNLLEELAREVSRAYVSCYRARVLPMRRRRGELGAPEASL